MIALAARDHEFSLRLPALDEILARELQCRFDRFGAAAGEPHFVEFTRCAVDQIVREFFRGLGREKARMRERELIGLFADRLAHRFIAVTEA